MFFQKKKGHSPEEMPRFADQQNNPRAITYDGAELSYLVQLNAQVPLWHRLPDQDQLGLRIPPYTATDEWLSNIIKESFDLLDKAYYFGAVGKHVQVKLKDQTDIHMEMQTGFVSLGWYCSEFEIPSLSRLWCLRASKAAFRNHTIVIDPEFVQNYPSTEGRVRHIVGVLAHEMLHAFLNIYTCDCSPHCWDRMFDYKGIGHPASGHGVLWCDAMVAVERAIDRDFGWNVDCGIPDGVTLEMTWCKRKPRQEQLEKWGVRLRGEEVVDGVVMEDYEE